MKNPTFDPALLAVFGAIRTAGGRTYLVGGAVRDQLLGRKSKDEDYLVTGLPLEDLLKVLKRFGRTDLVGASFGIVKFTPKGGATRDFALPRRERSTGIGHRDFEVQYGHSVTIEEDLARRDFTCNAIAQDTATGVIVDPFGGVADTAARQLKLVHDEAFLEDPLRMLRAVQFCARFDFIPEAELLRHLEHQVQLCSTVSPERISIELCKLLGAPKPSVGFRLMARCGLLEVVLPELAAQIGVQQPAQYHAYDVFDHCLAACDLMPARGHNRVWLRLTALLHDIGKKQTQTFKPDGTPQFLRHDEVGATMADELLTRLKFSSVPDAYIPVERIVHLIRHHMFQCDAESTPRAIRRFIAGVGRGSVMDQLRLRIADRSAKGIPQDNAQWVRLARTIRCIGHGTNSAFTVRELAINGRDIMQTLSVPPGPRVGKILNHLLEKVLEEPELNTSVALLAMARDCGI